MPFKQSRKLGKNQGTNIAERNIRTIEEAFSQTLEKPFGKNHKEIMCSKVGAFDDLMTSNEMVRASGASDAFDACIIFSPRRSRNEITEKTLH